MRTISQQEWARIISEHERWLDSAGKEGERANLTDANLTWFHLDQINLCKAKLCGADLRQANLEMAILRAADLQGAFLSSAVLSRADLTQANLQAADLSYCDFFGARLRKSSLCNANLTGASLIGADLSMADLSGACLDKANNSDWQVYNVICTHIFQRGQRIDFAPGEFEKKYTWLESVAEVMLRLPLSDLTLYAGPLMDQAVNQAQGEGAVRFKGVEALADDTTLFKFVLFAQAQEEIKASLNRIEQAINQQVPALAAPSSEAAPDEPEDIVGLRKNLAIPFTPLEVRPQAMEAALNRRFAALPPGLQALWQIMQAALKP